jgi:hypothetical protein
MSGGERRRKAAVLRLRESRRSSSHIHAAKKLDHWSISLELNRVSFWSLEDDFEPITRVETTCWVNPRKQKPDIGSVVRMIALKYW